LDGSTQLSLDLARRLAEALGGTPRFWSNREAQYRESINWVEADRWVRLLPGRDMAELGWMDWSGDWRDRVAACMTFFGAGEPGELATGRAALTATARFRAKPRTPEQEAAVTGWLRRVEIEAGSVSCEPWDQQRFRSLLPDLTRLSRTRDPRKFIPELQGLCAEVGVSVVIVRAPRNCPVSGVSRRLSTGTRLIGLSARFRTDDHLWFTFFHEAGHLVEHDPDVVFIDDIEKDIRDDGDPIEAEANRFASEILLPAGLRSTIPGRITGLTVRSLAREAGVSLGVVVGQLQHEGLISFRSKMNRLKGRYSWAGTTLIPSTV
jgi:hypothetical protein